MFVRMQQGDPFAVVPQAGWHSWPPERLSDRKQLYGYSQSLLIDVAEIDS